MPRLRINDRRPHGMMDDIIIFVTFIVLHETNITLNYNVFYLDEIVFNERDSSLTRKISLKCQECFPSSPINKVLIQDSSLEMCV